MDWMIDMMIMEENKNILYQSSLFHSDYEVKRVSGKDTTSFYRKYHYIGKGLICPFHYGEFENGRLVACASFGFLPSPNIPKTIWDKGSNANTLELRRLSSRSERKNAESHFIAECIKLLKKDYPSLRLIFSYADEKVGHRGTIYQASNFFYFGKRAGKTLYYGNGADKIHSRTAMRWKKNKSKNLRKVKLEEKNIDTFEKHLYVFVVAGKIERKHIIEEFKIKPVEYPKIIKQLL
jgi:hypothetical protein